MSHWFTRYRCFLPDLAGFSSSNCTAPQSLLDKRQQPLKRREWDSNPRWSYPHTRFPSVLLKPLGHLSKKPSDCITPISYREALTNRAEPKDNNPGIIVIPPCIEFRSLPVLAPPEPAAGP